MMLLILWDLEKSCLIPKVMSYLGQLRNEEVGGEKCRNARVERGSG